MMNTPLCGNLSKRAAGLPKLVVSTLDELAAIDSVSVRDGVTSNLPARGREASATDAPQPNCPSAVWHDPCMSTRQEERCRPATYARNLTS